ncbi:trigger factor [Mycoplasmopsis gallopavonis]|uniref:Trigger factor n=1 Tax=Mycoplasmopsis gallopavonis TaxID=76629 RepID=A0A449AZ04_9BACT|nr:trigger factor [Mycoplasmopsis gallopavonis]RIV16631.1 trigger factor [Mycoplasmopsis gallopavonis]VEU72686.1 Trigger factor [Mycoplasmopsis gallopavonis]
MIKLELKQELAQAEVIIEIPAEEVSKLVNNKVEIELKKVKVPGYRPGKAPKQEAIRRVDYAKVNQEVAKELLDKNLEKAIEKLTEEKLNGVRVLTDLATKEDGSVELKYFFVQAPNFENVNLEEIKVDLGQLVPTEDDKEKALNDLLERLALNKEITEGTTKLGDTVNINFKGFINDEPFDGGEAEGYDLVLGSNSFIPGFEDQLVGKELNWEGSINVKFPANYFSKEFQNKDAVFEVKINKIQRKDAPELTEELVKGFGITNVETIEDFKAWVANRARLNIFTTTTQKYLTDSIAKLVEVAKPVLHTSFIQEEIENIKKEFENQLKQFQIKKKEYLQLIKTTEEELENQFSEQAKARLVSEIAGQWLLQVKIKEVANQEDLAKLDESVFEFAPEEFKNMFLTESLKAEKLLELTKSDKLEEYKAVVKTFFTK